MSALLEKVRNEPVLVTALIGAVLYALTEFGVQVSDGQQAAILGVIGAVLAFVARSQVTPTSQPKHLAKDAGAVDAVTAILVVFIVVVLLAVLGLI